MKLVDVILFVLAFCLLIIGIHQAMVIGLAESYWIFMFSLMTLFLYRYRKAKAQNNQPNGVKNPKAQKKRKNG